MVHTAPYGSAARAGSATTQAVTSEPSRPAPAETGPDRGGPAPGVDHDPDVERGARREAVEDPPVALELARQHRPALGSEVPLDDEQDRRLAGADHRQGVGAQEPADQPDQRSLGHPGREAEAAIGVAGPQEGGEQVVGGQAVDHRRHGLGNAVGERGPAVGPDRALEREPATGFTSA